MSKVNLSLIVKWNKWDNISEVVDAWDEYCVNSNPDGFAERVDELRKEYGNVVVVGTWYDDEHVEGALTNKGLPGRGGD